MMQEREYYGVRRGITPKTESINFEMFQMGFMMVYDKFATDGYFQKYLGKDCVDGVIPGIIGRDVRTAVFFKVGKKLWPVYEMESTYEEVDYYTMIEFLYDCASKPTEFVYHEFAECGIHVRNSSDQLGRIEFREAINPILKKFKKLALSEDGEILEAVENGFEALFEAKIPTEDEEIQKRINQAQIKFRKTKSTVDDRRDALRDLADVLEMLRPKIKTVLMSKDENDLFQIANSFGIRHFNKKQKDEYDKPIWHAWIFYCYLATIHACLRLIEKQSSNPG